VDAILERCTEDVDWAADSAIEVAPWHGVKHGKAEVPSFFAGIGETGPVTEFTPLSFAANDDGDVMVFLRYAFTVTATGKDVATNLHHYLRSSRSVGNSDRRRYPSGSVVVTRCPTRLPAGRRLVARVASAVLHGIPRNERTSVGCLSLRAPPSAR
jgi:hypothetical protein